MDLTILEKKTKGRMPGKPDRSILCLTEKDSGVQRLLENNFLSIMRERKMDPYIHDISSWIYRANMENIPEKAVVEAKRCLLDVIGVGLAGSGQEAASLIRQLVVDNYGTGPCTLLGGGSAAVSPSGAAMANAAACHVLDFDDTCFDGIAHGSAVVFPAVMAGAENLQVSGREMLEAFIAGVEAIYRIGR